jgi:hypothetical protein
MSDKNDADHINAIASALAVPASLFETAYTTQYQPLQLSDTCISESVNCYLGMQAWAFQYLHELQMEIEAQKYAPDTDLPWDKYDNSPIPEWKLP